MRPTYWKLTAVSFFGFGLSEPSWHITRNPGGGCWPPQGAWVSATYGRRLMDATGSVRLERYPDPHAAGYSVVFQDAFWIFGGKTGGLGGTGFWDRVTYLK